MSFREYAWSFSFENKYLGHLYGITEISFIVSLTVVHCCHTETYHISMFPLVSRIQPTKGILQITMLCSIPTPQPQASIYKSV